MAMSTQAPGLGFGALPLHDASLDSLTVDWNAKSCVIQVRVVGGQPHSLSFRDVSNVSIPHKQPWGPSGFINALAENRGHFLIEMQSGDTIEVVAGGFDFVAI